MASFVLRKLDPDFWNRVQAKAAAEGSTVKAVILRLLAAWLAAVILVSVTACGSQMPTAPTPEAQPTHGTPSRIELTANPGMGAEAGSGVITARVLDAFAAALPGQTLTFSVSEGALSASSVVTDDRGVARATLTGPEGAGITISATVAGVTQKTQIAMQTKPAAALPIVPPVFPPPTPAPPPPPPQPPQPPALTVAFTASAPTVAMGGSIYFLVTSVTGFAAGEFVTAYQWDTDGDDTYEFTTGPSVTTHGSKVYTTAGLVTARVKVITSTRTTIATLGIVVTN